MARVSKHSQIMKEDFKCEFGMYCLLFKVSDQVLYNGVSVKMGAALNITLLFYND